MFLFRLSSCEKFYSSLRRETIPSAHNIEEVIPRLPRFHNQCVLDTLKSTQINLCSSFNLTNAKELLLYFLDPSLSLNNIGESCLNCTRLKKITLQVTQYKYLPIQRVMWYFQRFSQCFRNVYSNQKRQIKNKF